MLRFLLLLILILPLMTVCSAERTRPADTTYQQSLQPVTTMWESVRTLHPAWEKLYPVCLAYQDNYYLYQPAADGTWKFDKTVYRKGQVPKEIRAAYPLDWADNQIACVIDPSVLTSEKHLIIIFHEFVHCYQFNTCESTIKDSLKVYRAEMAKQNWMWELNYKFPYENKQVSKTYLAMLKAADKGKADQVRTLRHQLKSLISEQDWEYLTWQEFKEGTARYLENTLNAKYGYKQTTSSHKKPLNRVIFYEGGEKLIRLLAADNPDLPKDFPALWLALNKGW